MGTAEGDGLQVLGRSAVRGDYGVPQTRRRAIHCRMQVLRPLTGVPATQDAHLIRGREARRLRFSKPTATDYLPGAVKWRTVRDAIADFPQPKGNRYS